MLSLNDAIEALKGVRPHWTHQIITDASIDSRKVIPGSLFVALPGERVDGHDYVGDAFSR
jgi:UDP-N-acetylmuramoyl-tripeptide--D-alanyl-D-alanine ligase